MCRLKLDASHLLWANHIPAGCDTEGVRLLREISGRLPDPAAVKALLHALAGTGAAAISTFELLSSGAIEKLATYLHGGDLGQGDGRHWALLERLGAFAQVALPPGSGAAPPMAALVRALLGALGATERLPVHMNSVGAAPSSSMAAMYGMGYGARGAYGGYGGSLPRESPCRLAAWPTAFRTTRAATACADLTGC